MWKLILVVAGAVVLFGVGFAAGHTWCSSGQQGAVHDSIEDGKEAVEEVREVIKWRTKKVNVYVDRIQKVKDDTGCADTPIPIELDDELYEVYKLTGGSEAHGTVRVHPVPETNTPGTDPVEPTTVDDTGSAMGPCC